MRMIKGERFALFSLSMFVLMTVSEVSIGAPPLWRERPLFTPPKASQPFTFGAFSRIASRATPAVVSIETASGHSDFSAWSGLFELPRQQRGAGSGFIISSEGYLLTNFHVIKEANDIRVHLQSGQELAAEIIGVDPETDLALLKMSRAQPFPTVPLGDSDELKIGEWVLAIGNPLALSHTVTAGIVSAKGRRRVNPDGQLRYANFIQTDASINPGNSGGPLFNMSGQVIGINTAISARGQGIGFAIPMNMVKRLLPALLEYGRVRRSWLGISVREPGRADGRKSSGAEVAGVVPDGPAARAGLQVGDLIVRFGDQRLRDHEMLSWLASVTGIGAVVSLTVKRGRRNLKLRAVLGQLPRRGTQRPRPSAGSRDLDFEVEEREVGGQRVLRVTAVTAGSLAAKAGLRAGDLILKCGGDQVASAEALREAISGAGGVTRLQIQRGSEKSFIAY